MEMIENRNPPFDMVPERYRGHTLKNGCWFSVTAAAVSVLRGAGYRLTGFLYDDSGSTGIRLTQFQEFEAAVFFLSCGLTVTLSIDDRPAEMLGFDAGRGFAYGHGPQQMEERDIIHLAK